MEHIIFPQIHGIDLKTVDRPFLRAFARKFKDELMAKGLSSSDIAGHYNNILKEKTWDDTQTVSTNVNQQTIGDLRIFYTTVWYDFGQLAETIDMGFQSSIGKSNALSKLIFYTKDGIITMDTTASAVTDLASVSAEDLKPHKPTIADVKFKPEFTDALDSLLNLSSSGAIANLASLVTSINTIVKQNKEAEVNLKQMKAQISKKAVAFEAKEFNLDKAHNNNIPDGKFKTMLAKDIFTDPSGKKSDSLNFEVPMFEWDHDHPEVPIIDPNYIFNPESLISFLYGLVSNKNTWLHGHTGTGKTTFVEQVAARLNWPVIRVNLDNDIERSDFLGQTQLITGDKGATESKFVEGVLPRAMQSPSIFLIDEMDFGKSGIMYVLQRALEAKGLLITEDGGRLIEPHPLFRMVATANTRGQGDELGCYPGARTQSNALLDRFTVWINVDYMDSKQEALLLERMFPDTDAKFIGQLVTFSKEIRKAFVNRELLQSISPRSLMTICDSREFYSTLTTEDNATKLAIKSSYLQRATEDTVAKVNEISTRCFSSKAGAATSA